MRGHIDLGNHKLAGLYRPPAPRKRGKYKRSRMEKMPDGNYRQLWWIVDGAVRDAFANHPDYLTERGRMNAGKSVTKRVVGSLHGYAAQVARGRSVGPQAPADDAAAMVTDACTTGRGQWMKTLVKWVTSWVRVAKARTRGGDAKSPPEIHGARDG